MATRSVLFVCLLAAVGTAFAQCPIPSDVINSLDFTGADVNDGCVTTFSCPSCICALGTSAFNQLLVAPGFDLKGALGPNPTLETVSNLFSGCLLNLGATLGRDNSAAVTNLLSGGCDINSLPTDCVDNLLLQLQQAPPVTNAPPPVTDVMGSGSGDFSSPPMVSCPLTPTFISTLSFDDANITNGCNATTGSCDECVCGISTAMLAALEASMTPVEVVSLLSSLIPADAMGSPTDQLEQGGAVLLQACSTQLVPRLLAGQSTDVLSYLVGCSNTTTDPNAPIIPCYQALQATLERLQTQAGPVTRPPLPSGGAGSPGDSPAPPLPPASGSCPVPTTSIQMINFSTTAVTAQCSTQFSCVACVCELAKEAVTGIIGSGLTTAQLAAIFTQLAVVNGTASAGMSTSALAVAAGAQLVGSCSEPLVSRLIVSGQASSLDNLQTCGDLSPIFNATNGSLPDCASTVTSQIEAVLSAAGVGNIAFPPGMSAPPPSPLSATRVGGWLGLRSWMVAAAGAAMLALFA